MRLGLIGTGQMGQALEDVAVAAGHEIACRFNSSNPLEHVTSTSAFNGADVLVDFSLPDVVVGHIDLCCQLGIPLVVGATGWYDRMQEVRAWVDLHGASVLTASNFSLGIAMLSRSLRSIAPLIDRLPDFDISLQETHHINKADSPSGTAITLGNILLDGVNRKSWLDAEAQHGRIDPDAIHVASMRVGTVFGQHTVRLEGPHDRLELRHEAKNRIGFAQGALTAAEWLPGHSGLFTLDDMFDDWLERPAADTTRNEILELA